MKGYYYPEDKAWEIDSLVEAAEEMHSFCREVEDRARKEEGKRSQFYANFVTCYIPPWLQAIDKRI